MKIRFKRLLVKNGLTWKDLEFDFTKKGLTLIRGDNASGKSNIRELLSAVFYDRTEKSGRTNDIINRAAGKDLVILVDLSRKEPSGWVNYTVMCCRKCKSEPTGVRIWREDEEDPITPIKKPIEAQKMAESLLGMSFEEFNAVVSLGHESVHPLIEGTDSTRSEYISKTFDLEYDRYLEASLSRLKSIKTSISSLEVYKSEICVLERSSLSDSEVATLKRKANTLSEREADLSERIRNEDDRIRSLDRRCDAQKRRSKIMSILPPDFSPAHALEKSIAREKEKLGKIDNALREWSKIVDLKSESHKIKREIDRLKRNTTNKPLDVDSLVREHSSLKTTVSIQEGISGTKVCPTCRQNLHSVAISKKDLGILKARIEEIEHEIRNTRDNNDRLRKISSLMSRMKEVDNKISAIKPKGSISLWNDRRENAYTTIKKLEADIKNSIYYESCMKEVQSLPGGDYKKTMSRLSRMRSKRVDMENKIRKIRDSLTIIKSKIKEHKNVVSRIEHLKGITSGLSDMERDRDILSSLVDAFGRNGLKQTRVRDILGMMASYIHQYTSVLMPRYEFRLIDNEKKTSFIAIDKNDGTVGDVRSLSKGEKKRLSIALLLTERDIRRVKTNILFLDEFDGGLDKEGTEELVEILSDLKTEYESIFAITHNTEIQKFEGFDTRVAVSRPGTFSTISEQ